MKKTLLSILLVLMSYISFTQVCKPTLKPWSLSSTVGYTNFSTVKHPILRSQSNIWATLNINYSTNKWSYGTWGGYNYWLNEKTPDLRFGLSITRTITKW